VARAVRSVGPLILPSFCKRRFRLVALFVVISIGSCARLVAASRVDLDRDWMFRADPNPIGRHSDWQSHPPTDTLSINLPHTWNLGRQDGYLGKAWYCKTFAMLMQAPDLHAKLHFGALSTLRMYGSTEPRSEHTKVAILPTPSTSRASFERVTTEPWK